MCNKYTYIHICMSVLVPEDSWRSPPTPVYGKTTTHFLAFTWQNILSSQTRQVIVVFTLVLAFGFGRQQQPLSNKSSSNCGTKKHHRYQEFTDTLQWCSLLLSLPFLYSNFHANVFMTFFSVNFIAFHFLTNCQYPEAGTTFCFWLESLT